LEEKEVEKEYKILLGCKLDSLPFIWESQFILIDLKNENWKPMEDRFENKLSILIGKLF
jgi:chaperone required for assembly of F1-ATPase